MLKRTLACGLFLLFSLSSSATIITVEFTGKTTSSLDDASKTFYGIDSEGNFSSSVLIDITNRIKNPNVYYELVDSYGTNAVKADLHDKHLPAFTDYNGFNNYALIGATELDDYSTFYIYDTIYRENIEYVSDPSGYLAEYFHVEFWLNIFAHKYISELDSFDSKYEFSDLSDFDGTTGYAYYAHTTYNSINNQYETTLATMDFDITSLNFNVANSNTSLPASSPATVGLISIGLLGLVLRRKFK